MKKENNIKTIAASLGFFAIYTVVTNLVSLSVQFFYYFTYSELRIADYEAFKQQVQAAIQANSMYIALVQAGLFLVILFVIFRVRGTSLLTRIRWNPASKQIYALVAAFAIFNVITLNFLIDFLPKSWLQGVSDYTATFTSGGLFLNILLVVITGPFMEEVLMRGLMTVRLLGRLPLWFVIAFPTILFGLGHASGGMGQIIGTTITGLVFALIFVWTNSLRAAVLAHATNNLLAAFLPWDAIKAGMSTPIQLMVGIVGLAITVFMAHMIYKQWDKKIEIV